MKTPNPFIPVLLRSCGYLLRSVIATAIVFALLLSAPVLHAYGQDREENNLHARKRALRDSVKRVKKAAVTELNKQRDTASAVVDLPFQTFETNFLGYTWDSDDGPFMDFTISEAYHIQAFRKLDAKLSSRFVNLYSFKLYLAFTGRFGQYLVGRSSAPVVGKRFNPVVYFQYHDADHKLFRGRFGYGHESNGQSIGDSATFYATVKNAQGSSPNRALFINQTLDYISRGWDYIFVEGVRNWEDNGSVVGVADVTLRYYLNYGLLEGYREEYQAWEHNWYGKNLRRNDVSGVRASFDWYVGNNGFSWLKWRDFRVDYESGIAQPFRYNSVKLLAGFNLFTLPFCVTYANGYNGDLAQYGKRNHSFGVALALTTLRKPTSDLRYDVVGKTN
ncbi:MAG: repeat protein [Mucilaginibacter sp.]|nr:repeat protein [Mucilaginibacter sp.]